MDHNKLWKILKENTRPHYQSPGKPVCRSELDIEQMTGLKLEKEEDKAVLSAMQSISCEVLGWINHKLESRLPGEMSTTLDMQMIPL